MEDTSYASEMFMITPSDYSLLEEIKHKRVEKTQQQQEQQQQEQQQQEQQEQQQQQNTTRLVGIGVSGGRRLEHFR